MRDISRDCAETVVWGRSLKPAKLWHFQVASPPGDRMLAIVAWRLDPEAGIGFRSERAGRFPS